jgi:hypothetical protein
MGNLNRCIAPLNRYIQARFSKTWGYFAPVYCFHEPVHKKSGKLELVHCTIEPIQARFSKIKGYFAQVHCLHETVHKKSGKHEPVHISHIPVYGLFLFYLDVPVHRFSMY